ncbi:protein kinase [Streptomyces sp. R35]|uniref:non-specific serine/threonine protein kinase n=1 Tax=Streptomyces sp. R35 TaxID=3238630 RepID=A0AB39S361_9ACTN
MATGSSQSGVGRIIAGRYLLLDRIGSGGMGHVWRAHDQRLDCDVALKEIRFRNPSEAPEEQEAQIARARAEARHAAVLRGHPHVVTVHDVLEDEGLPWIVMEYVAGAEDLRHVLPRRGPLAPYEAARIGLAVLDALTAGHEHGIMHRDVKPANILLAPDRTGTPASRILLTDYGISVQPDSLETRWTRTSVLVGTPGYLAPERATGGPPTAAADLFSLGCTLYFIVEGVGPFDRDTDLAALTAVVLEDPRTPVRAGALRPLIEALLVKDPARRLSAEDTAAALARIITPELRPPTQADTGSQPPWAGFVTSDGNPDGAAPAPYTPTALDSGRPAPYTPTALDPGGPAPYSPTAYSPGAQDVGSAAPYSPTALGSNRPSVETPVPTGFGPPTPSTPQPGHGFGPPPGYPTPPVAPWQQPSGRRRGRRPRLLIALSSVVLGLGLAGGVYGYATAHKVGLPYGSQVGLAKPLKPGDCVVASRTGGRVTPLSYMEVDPSCDQRVPDGQVMNFYKASSLENARTFGPGLCRKMTHSTAEKMGSNVESVAVIPSAAGFEATGGKVACLLAGIHGPVYGPLGSFRPYAMIFHDPAQMQKGDCLRATGKDAKNIKEYKLVACDKEHSDQVVGFTQLDHSVPMAEANTVMNDECHQASLDGKFGATTDHTANHGVQSQGLWGKGFYWVVCTYAS